MSSYSGSSSSRGVGANKSRKGAPPTSIDSQSRARKSIYGGASRTLLSSASRKNVPMGASDKMSAPAKAPVQVSIVTDSYACTIITDIIPCERHFSLNLISLHFIRSLMKEARM